MWSCYVAHAALALGRDRGLLACMPGIGHACARADCKRARACHRGALYHTYGTRQYGLGQHGATLEHAYPPSTLTVWMTWSSEKMLSSSTLPSGVSRSLLSTLAKNFGPMGPPRCAAEADSSTASATSASGKRDTCARLVMVVAWFVGWDGRRQNQEI